MKRAPGRKRSLGEDPHLSPEPQLFLLFGLPRHNEPAWDTPSLLRVDGRGRASKKRPWTIVSPLSVELGLLRAPDAAEGRRREHAGHLQC